MPARLPLIERVSFWSSRRPFICPNCLRRTSSSSDNGLSRVQQLPKTRGRLAQLRTASTTPSVTAVNAKREIPAAYKELHASLRALEQDAGVYVNTSQLQLALRGIESEDAVTRIAVLGLNGQSGARRLTRALLADPLAKEQPWERQLLGSDEGDERAIILRYNDTFASDERHPLVRTLSIPCPILQSHRIEILVHTISSTFDPTNEGAASFLVPGLEIANSASGRSSMVTYPVHKALIYGEGLTSLGRFSMIEAQGIQRQQGSMMKGAIDWSWSTAQQQNVDGQPLVPINLSLAETAIEAFRSSLNRSLDYEHLWFDAGIPALSTWLIDGTGSQSGSMKLATRRLIETLSENTSQGIQHEASVKLQQEEDATVPVKSRVVIGQGISIWAENAHTELRDRLNSAFGSKSWGKTKWWKLFWRADDVGYIASDILRQAWLTEAEKEMIWVCGRIHQSGLLGPPKLRPEPVVDPEDEEQKLGGMPPAPSAEDLAPKTTDFNEPPPARHPWPQAIARARSTLSSMTVPPLQALSQALLLQTVSTNVLASSLSALLYVSISSTSPYESGAIAATGLVYSLRRLQRRWITARGEWEVAVREEGRRVLRSMESVLREPVDEYKPGVDKDGIKDRATATQAIGKVKKELEAIKV